MSGIAYRPQATLEIGTARFLDVMITGRTGRIIEAWRAGLEQDGIFMSYAGALEDLCMYGIGAYKEEEAEEF